MKKLVTIITVVLTVMSFTIPASAGLVHDVTYLSSETEFDNLVTSNAVTSAFVFRAGSTSTSGKELMAASGDVDTVWAFDSDNSIVLNYNGVSGHLSANGSTTVFDTPTTWFDTVLISLENNAPLDKYLEDLTFSDINIDGEGSINLYAPNPGDWSGVRIDLSNHGDGNQYPFTLDGNLIPTDGIYGAIGDHFRGEIYFLQTDVIPEPAAMSLIGVGGLTLWVIARRSRRRW